MQSWSDPNPSDATAAALASKSTVQAPGIGSLVSAILEDRYRKQQQQQQLIQSVSNSLGSAVKQYQGDQNNSALAGFMENNDPNVNAQIKAQLQGLPPDAQLAAVKYLQQQNAEADKTGMAADLTSARTNAQDALANQRWTGGTSGGTDPVLDERRRQIIEENDRKAKLDTAVANLSNVTGLPAAQIPGVMDSLSGYKAGQTAFPKIGTHEAITDGSQGDYKDRVLGAAQQYRDMLNPGGQQQTTVPQTVTPPSAAIDYLRAHPELAPQFDAKYGDGAAQRYF